MSGPEQDTPHQDQWVLPDPEGLAGSQDVEAGDSDDSDDTAAGRQVEETVAVQEKVEPAD
ncbi:hypothetical protein [Cryptosporangium minutisporangium]|uniref:Uncharacterized protein n=1 Tax=Cryptosporangium minutisporangium TaxID=113569 RepID=A0ABP6SYR2_9ACTN